MDERLRYRVAWLAAGWVQVVIVVILGMIPVKSGLGLNMDWVVHIVEFLVLMAWFGGVVSAKRHIYVAVALILLGAFIEVLQAANIFRSFDLRDIVANTVGVLLGLLLVRTVLRNWCHRVEAMFGGPAG